MNTAVLVAQSQNSGAVGPGAMLVMLFIWIVSIAAAIFLLRMMIDMIIFLSHQVG